MNKHKKRKYNKKAQGLGISTMIKLVLALTVLIILILLIRGQISKSSSAYTDLGDTAINDAKNTDKCESLFSSNACKTSTECSDLKGTFLLGYSGCKSDQVCCKR